MKEFLTEALVLDIEDSAEFDKIINLYTKELGRVSARARGARKITSKLTGHLQPLDFTRVRLIEKNGFQVADALTFKKMERIPESLATVKFVKEMTFELQPDRNLWNLLKKNIKISKKDLLSVLGFDPAFSECGVCDAKKPDFFLKAEQMFLCKRCAFKTPKNEIILIQ
ncbi:MAG: DNA repair protein RecO [Spirochaetota bacterium]